MNQNDHVLFDITSLSLPLALSWDASQSAAEHCRYVKYHFLTLITAHLIETLRCSGATELLASLEQVNSNGLMRLISAPDVVFHLLDNRAPNDQSRIAYLTEAIDAESRLHAKQQLRPGQWTALGDQGTHIDGTARWAKLLPSAIVIDGISPNATRPLQESTFREASLGPATLLSDAERHHAEILVSKSIHAIQKICPAAYALVCASVKTIVLRKSSKFGPMFTSSSSRLFVGRVLLVNAHVRGLSLAKLCGALIHEAIHSFLYRLELVRPLVRMSEEGARTVLISPWTGGRINLHTFVHACYIYYALYNFFGKLSAATHLTGAGTQLTYVRTGFTGQVLPTLLDPHRAMLTEEVLSDVAQMTKFVQTSELRARNQ